MNVQEFKYRVGQLKTRASMLQGKALDGTQLSAAITKDLDQILADVDNPEKMREREDFYKRAQHDPGLKAQMSSIRVRTINNFMLPSLVWIPFFAKITNLKENERPVQQNETQNVIRAGYIGANGEPRQTEIIKPQDEALIPLRWLATEEAIYKTVDIYRGRIVDVAEKTFNESFEMANMEDSEVFKLVTAPVEDGGMFGTFDFTNPKKHMWVYNPHPRIKKANLPTTNHVVLSGNTSSSGFRYEALDAAITYEAQWAGGFRDGDPKVVGRVIIPGKDITSISSQIRPTGNTRNKVADELLEKGSAEIRYFGRLWTLEANNTINPGCAYFEIDRKGCEVFYKPELDEDHVEDSAEYRKKGIEGRWMRKPFGIAANQAERIFAFRVQYNSGFDITDP